MCRCRRIEMWPCSDSHKAWAWKKKKHCTIGFTWLNNNSQLIVILEYIPRFPFPSRWKNDNHVVGLLMCGWGGVGWGGIGWINLLVCVGYMEHLKWINFSSNWYCIGKHEGLISKMHLRMFQISFVVFFSFIYFHFFLNVDIYGGLIDVWRSNSAIQMNSYSFASFYHFLPFIFMKVSHQVRYHDSQPNNELLIAKILFAGNGQLFV